MKFDAVYRSRRSNVRATRGIVATSQPLAANAGLDMLKAGGNAADAAIATAAMLNVVEPISTGIGGDCFALYWDAKTKEVTALNGSGRSPAAASIEDLHRQGYTYMPNFTGHAVSIPGTVAGWSDLLERHGRMTLADVLQPAIWTAENGYPASEMFMAVVGLAVAAIPEGLPAIMTITLAIGVQRMARRNAIIRRLPAVETLGSVSVICSDKTGTLTRNEMTVQSIVTSKHRFQVTGAGYAPQGEFLLYEREISVQERPLLQTVTRGALLCSDATLRETESGWSVDGDPTEGALLVAGMKAGLDPDFLRKTCPRTDEIPFESEHRFMATLHHDHEGHGFIYVKGAPERIFAMCERQHGFPADEALDRAYWDERIAELASRGERVLALAELTTTNNHRELRFQDVEQGLTLIGLFGLADPPRQEAIAAISQCQSAGIQVKMITGDHDGTALAIGRQLGLRTVSGAMTGQKIDELSDAELQQEVARVDIFARTSPEHKLRLVRALQSDGRIVAMTGDGVNDAPALKRADVGVAMGLKGTEAAKEAAEMVLADDNFASIAHAVEEGRTVYDNLKKAITFILPTNVGEALIIVAAIVLGQLLPITPVQILWVNMITAVTLALALAFEPAENDVMQRPPRQPREPILSAFLIWRVALVAVILVAGTFGLFLWEQAQGAEIELARTVAVNTLVMFEVFYLFNTRYLRAPVLNRAGLFGSRPVLISVAVVSLKKKGRTRRAVRLPVSGSSARGCRTLAP